MVSQSDDGAECFVGDGDVVVALRVRQTIKRGQARMASFVVVPALKRVKIVTVGIRFHVISRSVVLIKDASKFEESDKL